MPDTAIAWGRPPPSQWREGALTRVHELRALHAHLCGSGRTCEAVLHEGIIRHLDVAGAAAGERWKPWRSFFGATFERVHSNCDAAESSLLRIAPEYFLRGQMPSLVRHARRHLPPADERLAALLAVHEGLSRDCCPRETITQVQRDHVVAAVRAAGSAAGREFATVRSFRNVLIFTSIVLAVLAAGVAVLGFLWPRAVPLCFAPQPAAGQAASVVCPTGTTAATTGSDVDEVVAATANRWDLMVVEVIGLTAAAIASAASLARLQGSTVPFGLPVALSVLKLPTGALTAVAGLLLMRGAFIPGLSALDTSAQILAWAIVFGYAQQVFTRFVDRQANNVLDGVRGQETRNDDIS